MTQGLRRIAVTVLTLAAMLAGPALAAAGQPGIHGARGGVPDTTPPIDYDSPADVSEGFDDITLLPGLGWAFQNNSQPIGTTGWFQGNDAVFPAHAGAPTAYIAANFNNGAGVATISNWMLTPELALSDGDTVSFWTRTVTTPSFPDRLQVRMSTNGASTNVGTLATDVGDFTTLLLDINPTYTTGGYPNVWTQFTINLSGIPPGSTGRIGFRYFVEGGGPSGSNSDYIGIDTFEFVEGAAGASISLAKTVGTVAGACAATTSIQVPIGTPVTYCYTVTNTGALALNFHDLVDDQLGVILDDFPFALAPGASAFLTVDNVILPLGVTVNNATWTASDVVGNATSTTCNTPALAIPDNNPAGITNQMAIAAGGNLVDLDVSVDATHSWVGDVIFSLTNGTSTAVFFDRPGRTTTGFGCSGDNVDVTANDEGTDPAIESQCSTTPPAIAGNAVGGDPASATLLSVFDGQPLAGTWTLTASDSAGGDTGTVNEWCVIGTYAQPSTSASASASATVEVLDLAPDIQVSPSSLSSLQSPDTQVDLPLDISNLGDADLDWTIVEAASVAGGVRVAAVPGRQEPIRPNLRSVPPPANATTAGSESFSRAAGAEAGLRAAPRRGEVPDGTVTITHSATQNLVSGNSVACNNGIAHTDNSYVRYFTLSDFGISGDFAVTQVEMGIEQATGAGGSQPVVVNLYTWDPVDPFVFASFVPIGTANATVTDQSLTIVTVPVSGVAPAGSTLVVEFFTPNGQAVGNLLFVGSNPDGQTAPSYLAAADCGVPEPTDTALIGFPGMQLVMNVTGTVGGGCTGDVPWLAASPTAGTTLPLATDTVTVTLDSTGLAPGLYSGGLCVESNDPDTPSVVVPVTLEVDSMPFLDGFETGDTTRWSSVVP